MRGADLEVAGAVHPWNLYIISQKRVVKINNDDKWPNMAI